MAVFPLKVVTPIKTVFDGEAKSAILRTKEGDVCILANHENYVAPLGVGLLKIEDAQGKVLQGASAYGFLNVSGGSACAFVMTFELAEEIDVARAKEGLEEARLKIAEAAAPSGEIEEAKAKYARCKARLEVAQLTKK